MNNQKEFKKATDVVGEAYAHLVAVAITGSATLQEAAEKVEQVLNAMHWTLIGCVFETMKEGE